MTLPSDKSSMCPGWPEGLLANGIQVPTAPSTDRDVSNAPAANTSATHRVIARVIKRGILVFIRSFAELSRLSEPWRTAARVTDYWPTVVGPPNDTMVIALLMVMVSCEMLG